MNLNLDKYGVYVGVWAEQVGTGKANCKTCPGSSTINFTKGTLQHTPRQPSTLRRADLNYQILSKVLGKFHKKNNKKKNILMD